MKIQIVELNEQTLQVQVRYIDESFDPPISIEMHVGIMDGARPLSGEALWRRLSFALPSALLDIERAKRAAPDLSAVRQMVGQEHAPIPFTPDPATILPLPNHFSRPVL